MNLIISCPGVLLLSLVFGAAPAQSQQTKTQSGGYTTSVGD